MKYPLTAHRLRIALDNMNMTQQELADLSGIGKSSISHYINGANEPGNKSAYAMAKVLRVSPAWLMGLEVPMELKSDPDKKTDPEKLQKALTLYDLYREADPNIRAAIDSLLRSPQSSPEHPD